MRIYLDDCADSDRLVLELTRAGYEVFTPRSEGTFGIGDDLHMSYAAERGYVLLTKNPSDFRDLHAHYVAEGLSHSGILLVYQDNRGRDMTSREIVDAIGHLESSGIPIANETHNLNHWR